MKIIPKMYVIKTKQRKYTRLYLVIIKMAAISILYRGITKNPQQNEKIYAIFFVQNCP